MESPSLGLNQLSSILFQDKTEVKAASADKAKEDSKKPADAQPKEAEKPKEGDKAKPEALAKKEEDKNAAAKPASTDTEKEQHSMKMLHPGKFYGVTGMSFLIMMHWWRR